VIIISRDKYYSFSGASVYTSICNQFLSKKPKYRLLVFSSWTSLYASSRPTDRLRSINANRSPPERRQRSRRRGTTQVVVVWPCNITAYGIATCWSLAIAIHTPWTASLLRLQYARVYIHIYIAAVGRQSCAVIKRYCTRAREEQSIN